MPPLFTVVKRWIVNRSAGLLRSRGLSQLGRVTGSSAAAAHWKEPLLPFSRRLLVVLVFAFLLAPVALSSSGAWRSSSASWYGPGLYGNGVACGGFGRLEPWSNVVANRTLPCGTPVVVCFGGRCRSSVVADRGPYVYSRELDLGPGLAASLRFSGVHVVRWRVLSR